jgi:hypothetical protein
MIQAQIIFLADFTGRGSQLGSYCLARWVTTPSKSYYEFNMLGPYENFALLVSDLMLGLYSQKLLFWDVP